MGVVLAFQAFSWHRARKHADYACYSCIAACLQQHDRSEALFYHFRLKDQVPETHLLRLFEKHISFEFVRERLRSTYSESGRGVTPPDSGAGNYDRST